MHLDPLKNICAKLHAHKSQSETVICPSIELGIYKYGLAVMPIRVL